MCNWRWSHQCKSKSNYESKLMFFVPMELQSLIIPWMRSTNSTVIVAFIKQYFMQLPRPETSLPACSFVRPQNGSATSVSQWKDIHSWDEIGTNCLTHNNKLMQMLVRDGLATGNFHFKTRVFSSQSHQLSLQLNIHLYYNYIVIFRRHLRQINIVRLIQFPILIVHCQHNGLK